MSVYVNVYVKVGMCEFEFDVEAEVKAKVGMWRIGFRYGGWA